MYPFDLPEPLPRLQRWLAAGGRDRLGQAQLALGGQLDRRFLGSAEEAPGELSYLGPPLELFPLIWQGGDALHYGLLVHDRAVVAPMVSYAPGDSVGPRWIGDEAARGLANLLAYMRHVEHRSAWWRGVPAEDLRDHRERVESAVQEISSVLGVTVPPDAGELTEGARSDRMAIPTLPSGFVFEDCNDDVGVVAPASSFDPDLLAPEDEELFDLDRERAACESLLERGYPGSALALARNLYHFLRAMPGDGEVGARLMRRCYGALGRDFLAERVDAYLAAPQRTRADRGEPPPP